MSGARSPGERPAGLKISPAKALDALPLVALRRALVAEGRAFVMREHEYTVTADELQERMERDALMDRGLTLVARLPGVRVAGMVVLQRGRLERQRHVAYLEIGVDAAYRRQGLGDALLEAAVAWGRAHPEVQKLGLAVFADNESAQALYLRHGFVVEGRRVGEYLMEDGSLRDDLLMGCSVA